MGNAVEAAEAILSRTAAGEALPRRLAGALVRAVLHGGDRLERVAIGAGRLALALLEDDPHAADRAVELAGAVLKATRAARCGDDEPANRAGGGR